MSLNVFSTWMLSQQKAVLNGKTYSLQFISNIKDYWNSLCYVGKGENYSCKLLKDRRHETWLNYLKRVIYI